MKNKVKIMRSVADNLTHNIADERGRNKLWWESLPMTYEDWEADKRIPKTRNDFLKIEKKFLTESPYIKNKFKFKKFSGKSVLEIGCGSGVVSCLFAKAGAKVTAIDITKQAIDMVKRNAKLQKLKITALQKDAEKLNFSDGMFDYIFSWGVLHHSKNTTKAFGEVSRVLKKGGSGLIMVYNKNSARYYINGLYWLLLKGKIFQGYNLEKVQDFYTDGYYHRHFAPKELKSELEKLGLKCKNIFTTHMGHRMLPFAPLFFERWVKDNYGWLLVAEFEK